MKSQLNAHHKVIIVGTVALLCILSGLFFLEKSYENKFLPNSFIDDISVSGMNAESALQTLENNTRNLEAHELTVTFEDTQFSTSSASLGHSIDHKSAVETALNSQKSSNKIHRVISIFNSYSNKKYYDSPTKYDSEKLRSFLDTVNTEVEILGENPKAELKISHNPDSISIFPGKTGLKTDFSKTIELIHRELQSNNHSVTVITQETGGSLSQEEITQTTERAKHFVGKELVVSAEDTVFKLSDQELISLIDPTGSYNVGALTEIVQNWAGKTNREAQNAVFEYDAETLSVEKFIPHKDGLELDQDIAISQVATWLSEIESGQVSQKSGENTVDETILGTVSYELPLRKTNPSITLKDTNDLGIESRIGRGESYYHHSIPNRIHNVGITAEKISLTIIPPGTEFSFNKTLGEVSSKTGYRSAYVISGGRTVLGDGGGVCQVSSTLFRTVLDAGLDVTKRLQHSYRVSYYELNSDPGFDATVYSGDVDFRFINDTPGHIILVSHVDEDNLYMNIELYGTDDGRESQISNYKKWGAVGAPPSEYYPTTDLPTGVTKQIDWAVSGIKTEFTHTVKDKDGNIIHNDTYYSNYKPWSAKYMIGV